MRRLLLLPVLGLVLAGCGGDGLGDRGLTSSAADALQADVAAVVEGVRAKDGARSRDALKELRAEVARQLAAGEVTQERADEVLAAAAALPLPAMPVIAPSPAPVSSEEREEREERGKGKGKDEGKDEDD
jgi:HAMP domain-containing protein